METAMEVLSYLTANTSQYTAFDANQKTETREI